MHQTVLQSIMARDGPTAARGGTDTPSNAKDGCTFRMPAETFLHFGLT